MPDHIALDTFPSGAIEGLALLWVKDHSAEAQTPQDLCKMYWEAYHQIALVNKDTARAAQEKFRG